MVMKAASFPRLLPLFLVILISQTSVEAQAHPPSIRGWKPISNLTDPDVIAIAKFAINEYHKATGIELEFIKVLEGAKEVVENAANYDIIITAKEIDNLISKFEAIVWQDQGGIQRKLITFRKLL